MPLMINHLSGVLAIQAMPVDQRMYGLGYQEVDAATAAEAVSDVARGDIELGDRNHPDLSGDARLQCLDLPGAEQFAGRAGKRIAGPRAKHHGNIGQLQDTVRIPPAGKAGKRVFTEQQAQVATRQIGVQRAKRIDGVRRAGAAQFPVIGYQFRVSVASRLQHCQAQLRWRLRLVAVDRVGQRNQPYLGQGELLEGVQRDAQVAIVDRVEGSSEDADGGAVGRAEGSGGDVAAQVSLTDC